MTKRLLLEIARGFGGMKLIENYDEATRIAAVREFIYAMREERKLSGRKTLLDDIENRRLFMEYAKITPSLFKNWE